jgi:hypothetical protein
MAPTPGRVEATSCIALAVETQKLATAVASQIEAIHFLNFISRANFLFLRRVLNNLLDKQQYA